MAKICDIREIQSAAMRLAQAKVRELRNAKVPVTGEVLSELLKMANAEVRDECSPASNVLTCEQMDALKKICPPCASKFTVKDVNSEAAESVE